MKSCAITVDRLDLVVKSFATLANDCVVDGVDTSGSFALTEIRAGGALVQASESHTVPATVLELCGEGALRALHFGFASQRMQVVALRLWLFLCLHFADAMEIVVVCSLAINMHLLVVLARLFCANIVHGVNALGLLFAADCAATFVVVHDGVQDAVCGGIQVTQDLCCRRTKLLRMMHRELAVIMCGGRRREHCQSQDSKGRHHRFETIRFG